MAFTWANKERRAFIAMAGSLAKANPQEHFRYRPVGEDQETAEKVFLEVNQPLSAQMYYAGNGAIDHHNCVRAKELRIEKRMVT